MRAHKYLVRCTRWGLGFVPWMPPPRSQTATTLLRVFASRERCAPPSAVYVCLCSGNHNGTLVFGASPLQGTIPPGGEQKVTMSFSPDHPSRAEFQSTFRCVFVDSPCFTAVRQWWRHWKSRVVVAAHAHEWVVFSLSPALGIDGGWVGTDMFRCGAV